MGRMRHGLDGMIKAKLAGTVIKSDDGWQWFQGMLQLWMFMCVHHYVHMYVLTMLSIVFIDVLKCV